MREISMTFFMQDWVVKDASYYFRNEQLNLTITDLFQE